MKPLVIIPARGGSKGVPGKNIRPLAGKPLIHYTIEAARAVFPDQVICVSTDSPSIHSSVEETGLNVPFLRPVELATDEAGTREVILHAVQFYEQQGYLPDVVILLQPTSPFRGARHIREALPLFDATCDLVVSVKETRANPYYLLYEENDQGWLAKSKTGSFVRRQDCPPVYELNGAIYLIRPATLKARPLNQFSRIRKYIMDEQDSLDIDTEFDFKMAELLMAENQ